MENVIPFTMTFVSVKDMNILCLKLERNVCSLFLKVRLLRYRRCKYLSSILLTNSRVSPSNICRVLLVTALAQSGSENKELSVPEVGQEVQRFLEKRLLRLTTMPCDVENRI